MPTVSENAAELHPLLAAAEQPAVSTTRSSQHALLLPLLRSVSNADFEGRCKGARPTQHPGVGELGCRLILQMVELYGRVHVATQKVERTPPIYLPPASSASAPLGLWRWCAISAAARHKTV